MLILLYLGTHRNGSAITKLIDKYDSIALTEIWEHAIKSITQLINRVDKLSLNMPLVSTY